MDHITRCFVLEHRADDVRQLALQAARYPGVDMPMACLQIAGWQMAERKMPTWAVTEGLLYPPHLSLEQCSSEETARYKAQLVEGDSFVDLTGGMGVDFSFMARGRSSKTLVEREASLCELARHNLPLLGLGAQVVCDDAEHYLEQMEPVDTIYLDPARRGTAGNKVFALADCSPDVSKLASKLLAKAPQVIVKLSPMLDITQALRQLTNVRVVHVIAVGGECKELVVEMRRDWDASGVYGVHCVNMHPNGRIDRFSYSSEDVENATAPMCQERQLTAGNYLYEPNATIMKAGSYDLFAQRNGLWVVSADSHLMVGDHLLEGFPGRTFKIEAVSSTNKRELKTVLKGVKRANVAVRNFPMKAAELARRLGLKDGGDTYVFGTTTAAGQHIVIKTTKITHDF